MKWFIFLLLVLASCGVKKPLTTTKIVGNDTIIETVYVSLTRQERLAIKDSLKHELKMAKVERLVIRDSIKYVYKTKWIDKVRYKDSIKWIYKEIKQENKHVESIKKQEVKLSKSNWWVWMLVGSIVTLIIIFIFKR